MASGRFRVGGPLRAESRDHLGRDLIELLTYSAFLNTSPPTLAFQQKRLILVCFILKECLNGGGIGVETWNVIMHNFIKVNL